MLNEEIKLLVCDLDGTLLDDNKQVTPYTAGVLREAREKGMKVCFASGRYESMMSVYTDSVGGIDYNLSCNGAMAREEQTGEVIFCAAMTSETVDQILAYLREQKMAFMMYATGTIYYLDRPRLAKRLKDYEALTAKMGFPKTLHSKAISLDQKECYQDVVKIVAYEDDEERLGQFEQFIADLPGVHCESTGYGLMSAADLKASKKTALYTIMEKMQITEKNVCVFGDYTNDLSMFECASHRIAMANAVQEVKDRATYITDSNNEDGVAHYIEKLLGK